MMYMQPELFGAEGRLCPVSDMEVRHCEEETIPKGYPCDETVYELCNIVMEENMWETPSNMEEGQTLYENLRGMLKQML